MKLIDNLLDLVFVPSCVSCRTRLSHGYLCPACQELYEKRKHRLCSSCGERYDACLCVPEALAKVGVKAHAKLFLYDPLLPGMPENQMLYTMKRKNHRALSLGLSKELADAVAPILPEGKCFVTYMPRSRRAEREYGVDQSRVLAKLVSKELAIPFRAVFRHTGSQTQKQLSKSAREKNAKEAYCLKEKYDFSEESIILIDDVLTSGATLAAGARLLRQNRAKNVVVLTLAVVKNASHSAKY